MNCDNPENHEAATAGIICAPKPGIAMPETHGPENPAQDTQAKALKEFEKLTIRYQKAALWTAVVVAGITAVYASISYQQWQALVEANRFADRSSRAAQSAAESARMAIKEAEESTRLDERAWITPGSMTLFPSTPQAGQPISIRIELVNNGKTPAGDVKMSCKVEDERSKRLPSFLYTGDDTVRFGMIPPTSAGAPVAVSVQVYLWGNKRRQDPRRAPKDFIDKLNSGKVTIFAHGCVSYADVFGERHWTSYCLFFRKNNTTGLQPQVCEAHNGTGDGGADQCSDM